MKISITPYDTLFFRDGRPFNSAEDNWAGSIFPPYPSTIYGALRTAYFGIHPDELKHAATESDPTSNLRISDIYFRSEEKNMRLLPRDMIKIVSENDKESEEFSATGLQLTKNPGSNSGTPFLLTTENRVSNINALITETDFRALLSNPQKPVNAIAFRKFFETESKIGIGRDNQTRTAADGMIYRVGMMRVKNLSIVVEFSGLDLPETGTVKLGGEGKLCEYSSLKETAPAPIPEIDKFFKLILQTPAFFEQGWSPTAVNGKYDFGGVECELVAAAVDRALSIGGWDMKKNRPKPMRKAVPAGSVYYFRISNATTNAGQKLTEYFENTPLTEDWTECMFFPSVPEGYGQVAVGNVVL